MPYAKNKLTQKTIAGDLPPGHYGDGDGLYLRVQPGGSRQWVLVYHVRGKRKEAGLGGYPTVGLTQARAKRDHMRADIAAGRIPNRSTKGGPLGRGDAFGRVALSLINDIGEGFKSDKHRQQWRNTLQTYAEPIWNTPVDLVDTTAVLECLRPIWTRIPETADRVRARIERVLDAARVRGLREGENPARWRGHLALIMPANRKPHTHHPAMPYQQVPQFLATLRSAEGLAARALEFTILTGVRTGETLGAHVGELNGELWVIPGGRMKCGKEHRVPLVGRALEIARSTDTDGLLFPGTRPGKPLSKMSMAMTLRRRHPEFTVHGFRSSFRDWAGDTTEFAEEIVEQALAHTVGSAVRRAYRRGDALDKRRELMKAWDAYCCPPARPSRRARWLA